MTDSGVKPGEGMIYPKMSISDWLKKHPSLIGALPIECLCGRTYSDAVPYLTEKMVGFEVTKCKCGCGPLSVATPHCPETIAFYRRIFTNLMRAVR